MAQQILNENSISPDDGLGDTPPVYTQKANDNFTELYNASSSLNPLSKLVAVFSDADLPPALAGVRSFESGKSYVFFNSVTTGDQFAMGASTEITAIGRNIVLTYTGSTNFITSSDNSFSVSNITILANGSGARVFQFSTTSLKIMRVDDCTIQCDFFGDFSGTQWAAAIRNCSILPFFSGAVTCSGTCRSFNWDTSGVIPVTGIVFDLGTCVFDSLVIEKVVYDLPAGTTFISGLTNSGNIAATGRGLVINCEGNNTGGTDLVGVDVGDARWKFADNTPIEDSRKDFIMYFENNATATTINTAGVYELVAGTWLEDHANGFTTDANGRATYIGVEDFNFPVDATVSLEPVSGTNKDLAVKFAVNGTEVGVEFPRRTDSGNPGVIGIPWQVTLSNGDYIELFVANITDTTNVTVIAATVRGN